MKDRTQHGATTYETDYAKSAREARAEAEALNLPEPAPAEPEPLTSPLPAEPARPVVASIPAPPPKVTAMNFGEALVALKAGARLARDGWNGKNAWICLVRGGAEMFGVPVQDCIGMRTGVKTMQPGWIPSQADMLADDWSVGGA